MAAFSATTNFIARRYWPGFHCNFIIIISFLYKSMIWNIHMRDSDYFNCENLTMRSSKVFCKEWQQFLLRLTYLLKDSDLDFTGILWKWSALYTRAWYEILQRRCKHDSNYENWKWQVKQIGCKKMGALSKTTHFAVALFDWFLLIISTVFSKDKVENIIKWFQS